MEHITLLIEPGPHQRLARIHEALRDLGLERCGQCSIWKGQEHMVCHQFDGGKTAAPFTLIRCSDCGSPVEQLAQFAPGDAK